MEEKEMYTKSKLGWTPKAISYLDLVAVWTIPFAIIGALITIVSLMEMYQSIMAKDYTNVLFSGCSLLLVGAATFFSVWFIKDAKKGTSYRDEELICSALERLKYVFILTIVLLLYKVVLFASMFW